MTTLPTPTPAGATLSGPAIRDEATLAATLRERGLPGQRSKTAILRLRRARASITLPPPMTPLNVRAERMILARFRAEAKRRGVFVEVIDSCTKESAPQIADKATVNGLGCTSSRPAGGTPTGARARDCGRCPGCTGPTTPGRGRGGCPPPPRRSGPR